MRYTDQSLAPIIHMSERDREFARYVPRDVVYLPEGGYVDLNLPTEKMTRTAYVGGAEVRVTMEYPEDADEIRSPFPSIIAHGYCASEHAYHGQRHALASNGIVTATYDSPRKQDRYAGWHPKHALHPERLLRQALSVSTLTVFEMAEELRLGTAESVDVNAHSMGGRSAVLAATDMPAHYRTVLLNQAAGLEKQNLPMMLGRLKEFRKEIPGTDWEILFGSMGYILSNPFKTAIEGLAVANTDIRENVKELGSLGVRTAILVGRADTLIPAARVAKSSGEGVADLFAVYADKNAGHLYLQKHPLESAMAHLQTLKLLHNYNFRLDQILAA